jgi:putative ABC transport system permease protein
VIDRSSLDAIAAKVPAGAAAAEPGAQGGGSSPVFAPELAVRQELQLRYDHTQLPGDPVSAQTWLTDVRHRIEGRGAGAFVVADDASASLEPIASDLVWGQILFIFLAFPGVALALALSRLAADATADATRRHATLLRARGATPRQLQKVFMGATALTAFAGAAAGALLGVLLAWVRFGPELSASDPVGAILRALLIAIVASTILATAAAALPLRDQLRQEVALGRQELQRASSPLWQRLYLDVVAIVAAAIVYLVIGSIHPVIGAEGNPTVTIALTSFLAPLLLWTGGTLLLLRLSQRAMTRSGRLAGWLERILGPGGELAGRSLTARAAAASRAIVVLALSVSFATSVLIFDATYRQQQRVDAQLSLGADLKIAPIQPTDAPAVAGLAGPGISSVTPFVDRIVYVGSEAQDLLAIDPGTLPQVTTLADTFFRGISGADAMAALRSQPDGILVSDETAKDYSIVPGDRVRIRVPDVNGNLVQVDFRMVGIALEFPTAPKDAFLVGNQAFVASQTGNNRISFALARASGDPTDVARSLGSRLGSTWQVTDLGATNARLANSITSVDLADLVLLDLFFAVLIAAAGAALFLLAGLAERRRELATIEAIGAEPRQLRALVLGEATVIGLSGLLIGVLSGAVVGFTLLQIMAGLFDPPADLPTVPLAALLATALAVIVALGAAVFVADRALARLGVLALLRER